MNTKSFVFDTPISQKYGVKQGQVYGYARVIGTAEYRGGPYFDRDYCSLNITQVLAKVGIVEADMTLAYHISKQLSDTLAEIIEDAAFAHCEYLFNPLAKEVVDIEYTDITQEEYTETEQAVVKEYAVTMIIEQPKNEAA